MESEIGKSSRSVLASETVCVTVIVLHHHGYATMWTFRSFISQEDMDENHLYGIMLEHTRIP
ncbi:hypothetical protein CERSUDRAFT_88329 [Gelatoporia subvermispora B]|uniref:Uncharacterized protein n=1 Tax=Ceriporiopsis subvermispora (strain B) TaxID=914234 RepID=M2R195_CERS8|nr:hypothetical protein CERSUDRAFT_88329 [Gelatoporia subvermispora B]